MEGGLVYQNILTTRWPVEQCLEDTNFLLRIGKKHIRQKSGMSTYKKHSSN